MIPLLPPNTPFPDPRAGIALHDGLVCVTEDLTPTRLLAAYPNGIFPWHDDGQFFYWFSTAPRAVLLPERLHVSRSLRKTLKNQKYRVAVNEQFATVVAACAQIERAGQDGSWIFPSFERAYTELHHLGYAHSFEYYNENNELAGGLYGVQIGRVFFGESMFAHQGDASKMAFAHAVPFLARCGVQLIDCQQDTGHLRRFGSQTMDFDDFQAALKHLTTQNLSQKIISQTIVNRLDHA